MPFFRTLIITVIAISSYHAIAENDVRSYVRSYVSSAKPPVIIELFTSEGCSSCPPAEQWLNGFTRRKGLWDQYFPIAWHVDYWDAIGWPDRFANPRYSARQWRYKKQTPLHSVYTPGVLVNGRAWRGWVTDRLPAVAKTTAPGRLRVDVDGHHFHAVFQPIEANASRGYKLRLAVLGFGFTTQVKRGENAGRRLRHDFVVIADADLGSAGDNQWRGDLPGVAEAGRRRAVVFWLESSTSPVPLQVAGGWLPRQ